MYHYFFFADIQIQKVHTEKRQKDLEPLYNDFFNSKPKIPVASCNRLSISPPSSTETYLHLVYVSSLPLSRRRLFLVGIVAKAWWATMASFSFIAHMILRNLNIFISDLKVFDLQIYPFKLISNFLIVQTITFHNYRSIYVYIFRVHWYMMVYVYNAKKTKIYHYIYTSFKYCIHVHYHLCCTHVRHQPLMYICTNECTQLNNKLDI